MPGNSDVDVNAAITKNPTLHSTYFIDIPIDIEVLDDPHPVTAGLEDFTMTDTYYGNIYMAPDVHPLLGTTHDDVWDAIAWTHTYENSKVVYIMPGFGAGAFENDSYKKLITNALSYVGSSQ